MQLHPTPASEWVKFSEADRKLLQSIGGVPVNDIFLPLWESKRKVILAYGGWGSGKTKFILLKQLHKALTQKYYLGFFGRAILSDVRSTVHSTLCTVIEENGLKPFFKYSREPNGSMIIDCKVTGHRMYPFGCSDTDSMKGLDDATDIFVDELDGIDLADFTKIVGRLRTIKAITQFWGAFNTEKVYDDHWLKVNVFNENSGITNIEKLFVNFPDNYFLNHDEYNETLWMAACGNELIYNAIAAGEWGAMINDNPWLYALDIKKHFRDVQFMPGYPVYISFDFNNDPFACTIRQSSPKLGLPSSFIHYIDEIVGQVKVEDTCNIIKSRYPGSIIYITGDRSGSNEDLGRNQTLYQIIQSLLGLSDAQVHTNTSNLLHSDSRVLMNTMIHHHPNFYISGKCKSLRADCMKAAVDVENKLPSHLLKDRGNYKMDAFDAMRYDFQTHFLKFAKEVYFKVLKK